MVDETEIFQGAENSLRMQQTYTHDFQCLYHLAKYPFDTQVKQVSQHLALVQVCSVDMSVNLETVVLQPDELLVTQHGDMNLFLITETDLRYQDTNDHKKGIKVIIKMKRKITSEMLTTFFPSMLLMLITFSTTFFKPYFFEAALSVNLTTMLVMTTIFISKMEGLPQTSEAKMIDYWLILCQLVPFTEVVLITSKEYLREDEITGIQGYKRRSQHKGNIDAKIKGTETDSIESMTCTIMEAAEAWTNDEELVSITMVLITLGES